MVRASRNSTPWSRPFAHAIFVVVLAMGLTPQTASSAPPTAPNPGKWTGSNTWGVVAVHMALFPGDTSTANSSILAYQGEDQTTFSGALWRWKLPLDDSVNTGYFPVSAFSARPLQLAPYDVFCSSHVHLADGRLLIAGGHDNVTAEIGTRHADGSLS